MYAQTHDYNSNVGALLREYQYQLQRQIRVGWADLPLVTMAVDRDEILGLRSCRGRCPTPFPFDDDVEEDEPSVFFDCREYQSDDDNSDDDDDNDVLTTAYKSCRDRPPTPYPYHTPTAYKSCRDRPPTPYPFETKKVSKSSISSPSLPGSPKSATSLSSSSNSGKSNKLHRIWTTLSSSSRSSLTTASLAALSPPTSPLTLSRSPSLMVNVDIDAQMERVPTTIRVGLRKKIGRALKWVGDEVYEFGDKWV